MPARHLTQAWSERIERWLQEETTLSMPEPYDKDLVAGLASSLRAAWSRDPLPPKATEKVAPVRFSPPPAE